MKVLEQTHQPAHVMILTSMTMEHAYNAHSLVLTAPVFQFALVAFQVIDKLLSANAMILTSMTMEHVQHAYYHV